MYLADPDPEHCLEASPHNRAVHTDAGAAAAAVAVIVDKEHCLKVETQLALRLQLMLELNALRRRLHIHREVGEPKGVKSPRRRRIVPRAAALVHFHKSRTNTAAAAGITSSSHVQKSGRVSLDRGAGDGLAIDAQRIGHLSRHGAATLEIGAKNAEGEGAILLQTEHVTGGQFDKLLARHVFPFDKVEEFGELVADGLAFPVGGGDHFRRLLG